MRRPKTSSGSARALRAALPGRDAPGDQPLPVQDLPPDGRAVDACGVGTNRRVTVSGNVEAFGRRRVEVVAKVRTWPVSCSTPSDGRLPRGDGQGDVPGPGQQPLSHQRGQPRGPDGPAGVAAPDFLSHYGPHLNPKEREWRYFKRDCRSHLARTPRGFVDGIPKGLKNLGGARRDVVDEVPEWFITGHRKAPTGRHLAGPRVRVTPSRANPTRERTYLRILSSTLAICG